MRLREILKDKEYPMIEERMFGILPGGTPFNTLSGVFGYMDGKLVSWDGDTYSLHHNYDRFEEFTLDKDITLRAIADHATYECKRGTICLTVWQEESVGKRNE